ncbi:MAG: hypothetical protein CL928_12285 [Deltaproteobacteria bacterium]|nr:hypothetical protein [Deltaproteobacteria bacterium]
MMLGSNQPVGTGMQDSPIAGRHQSIMALQPGAQAQEALHGIAMTVQVGRRVAGCDPEAGAIEAGVEEFVGPLESKRHLAHTSQPKRTLQQVRSGHLRPVVGSRDGAAGLPRLERAQNPLHNRGVLNQRHGERCIKDIRGALSAQPARVEPASNHSATLAREFRGPFPLK